MTTTRREFLKNIGTVTMGAVTAAATGPLQAATPDGFPPKRGGDPRHRWAMVVDMRRCIACQACTVSCSVENQAPLHQFRTIVSQYQVKDLDRPEQPVALVDLPRLCNHCDSPPCIMACPVRPQRATYQQKDGIVLVNNEMCLGCGACAYACPYGARFVNSETHTADKCTLCVHRIKVGLLPACVESCVGGARVFGDLRDPKSEVRKLLARYKVKVLQPEKHTRPNVYYIGMDAKFEHNTDRINKRG